jgi:hypothetical protein
VTELMTGCGKSGENAWQEAYFHRPSRSGEGLRKAEGVGLGLLLGWKGMPSWSRSSALQMS